MSNIDYQLGFSAGYARAKAEAKHGQWIFTEYESGDAEYCCSECGEGVYDRPNYCPNCGADMREVEE